MRTYVIHKDYKDIEDFVLKIPSLFEKGEGKVIYKGRNELREFECSGKSFIVKSYKKPNSKQVHLRYFQTFKSKTFI